MRRNGVKTTNSWSDAYYTAFTLYGGERPLVVSYATSPAAEVFFSKGKYPTPPSGNLFLKGGVFRQVEGAAVLRGAREPAFGAAIGALFAKPEVQRALPAEMWVYPAVKNTPLPKVFALAQAPAEKRHPRPKRNHPATKHWVSRSIQPVLK